MESFLQMDMWKEKAQKAVCRMLAEMPPLANVSVKLGDQFMDIKLEIQVKTKSAPSVKKRTSVLTCLIDLNT